METNGKRILVAEDDRFLRRACEMSLRQLTLFQDGLAKVFIGKTSLEEVLRVAL